MLIGTKFGQLSVKSLKTVRYLQGRTWLFPGSAASAIEGTSIRRPRYLSGWASARTAPTPITMRPSGAGGLPHPSTGGTFLACPSCDRGTDRAQQPVLPR